MLLSLVLILLLIWAAVVGSLYSNFIVFYKSFSETDSYNKAYYTSIAGLERWELVTKQREIGYVGSWWWKWMTSTPSIDSTDYIESGFSYLVESEDTNLLRDVNSRTTRIPKIWEWDVDWMLSTWDSIDYNKMDYENAEVFSLYYDESTTDSPYTKKSCSSGDCTDSKTRIKWEIRLPPKILEAFWVNWSLDATDSLVVGWRKNDEIVDWQFRWFTDWNPFTIFARNKANSDSAWALAEDSIIRESEINEKVKINSHKDTSSTQWRRQINEKKTRESKLVVVSAGSFDGVNNFEDITEESNYTRLNFRLSLLNLLKSKGKQVYPYLEYYLYFNRPVSDKYFRIDGEGRYKDYQVNIIMYKPTVKESVLWSFTVIF